MLQEAIRQGIWNYSADIGHNTWQAMIAMALAQDRPLDLKFDGHKEVVAYLLSKLASIKFEGEHMHVSTSLRALFALWEQKEEAERASLLPWGPPGFGALDMQQSTDGVWGLDDEDDVED